MFWWPPPHAPGFSPGLRGRSGLATTASERARSGHRALGLRDMDQAGDPLLAKVLGHSHERTTKTYAHLLPDHLARSMNAVNFAPAFGPSTLEAATAQVRQNPGQRAGQSSS